MNEFGTNLGGAMASEASKYQLTEDEVHKLISTANNRRNRLIIELLAFTGCRRGELILLRRMDINLEKNIIRMPTIKRRKGTPYENCRTVPIISEKLKMDLEFYLEVTDLKYKPSRYSRLLQRVQNRNENGLTDVRINQIVADISDKAGVKSPNPHRKHVHPHMFRHNFVRFARRYGLNHKAISQIIGHQSVATTMDLYGIPDENELIEEASKMRGYGEVKLGLKWRKV